MAKLRIIGTSQKGLDMNYVSQSDLSKIPDCEMFFRPQTKNAYIIANDNLLGGK